MAAFTAAATAVGVAASVYGANKAAGAARDAADSANEQSDKWLKYTQEQRQKALDAYGSYSSTQAANLDKAIQVQTRNVQRQEALVNSIDPSLIEAGKQMTQLLQGQSAPVLQNIKDQRQVQRNGLLDSLRQNYGPGGESSQAGINALQKFDTETTSMLSGAQQDYLSKVSNIALGGASLGASLGGEAGRLAELGKQYGDIGKTSADIINGQSSSPAYQSKVQTAGAAGVPGVLEGKMYAGLGEGIGKIGGLLDSWNSGPSTTGAPAPSPTPSTGAGTYGSSPSANNGYKNAFGGDTLAARLGA